MIRRTTDVSDEKLSEGKMYDVEDVAKEVKKILPKGFKLDFGDSEVEDWVYTWYDILYNGKQVGQLEFAHAVYEGWLYINVKDENDKVVFESEPLGEFTGDYDDDEAQSKFFEIALKDFRKIKSKLTKGIEKLKPKA